MTVNTEIDLEKKGDDTVKLDAGVSVSKPNVRADLRKPFYAWVGLNDAAVGQFREFPTQVRELPGDVAAQVKTLRQQVEEYASQIQERATSLYTGYAERGERLVQSIRRQPSTQTAVREAKKAQNSSGATAEHAKRSAKAAERAVEDAANKVG